MAAADCSRLCSKVSPPSQAHVSPAVCCFSRLDLLTDPLLIAFDPATPWPPALAANRGAAFVSQQLEESAAKVGAFLQAQRELQVGWEEWACENEVVMFEGERAALLT